jgi:hypothetical protein
MDGAIVIMTREKPKARGLTLNDLLPDCWECREGIRLLLPMMEAANALPFCQVCSGAENIVVLKPHYNLNYKFRAASRSICAFSLVMINPKWQARVSSRFLCLLRQVLCM